MKRFLIIFLGIICFNGIKAESDLKIITDSALNYYINADYDDALRIYKNLYDNNNSSAELFYNMGNCYYKTGDIANAIFFYEKANILDPNDKDIQHNLKIANTKTKDKVEQIQEVFYIRWYKNFVSLMSSDSWAIFSITTFILSLALIGLFLFSKKLLIRKLGFITGIISFVFSIFSLIFSLNQANNISNNHSAIVFEYSVVKSSPLDESTNLFEINEGLKVEIMDSLNSWINIRLSDGKEGWIPYKNVKKL